MYFPDNRNLFPQEEVMALMLLIEARFNHLMEVSKAGDFPFFFAKMPLLACREEVVNRFFELEPSQEFLRKALKMCQHPVMLPVFEAWLQTNPSTEEIERFREYCKDFLAAYPEAAKKVDSL